MWFGLSLFILPRHRGVVFLCVLLDCGTVGIVTLVALRGGEADHDCRWMDDSRCQRIPGPSIDRRREIGRVSEHSKRSSKLDHGTGPPSSGEQRRSRPGMMASPGPTGFIMACVDPLLTGGWRACKNYVDAQPTIAWLF